MNKVPNPIDKHVGARVRLRRLMVGMSQGKLGEALAVTFQQVQKYEKGANRIGASRLQQLARVLEVPPSYFFDGAPSSDGTALGFAESNGSSNTVDFVLTSEGLQLNRAFAAIKDHKVRKRILDLVESLSAASE
jgi:transcriptional regulator with XRE-family HTH domain